MKFPFLTTILVGTMLIVSACATTPGGNPLCHNKRDPFVKSLLKNVDNKGLEATINQLRKGFVDNQGSVTSDDYIVAKKLLTAKANAEPVGELTATQEQIAACYGYTPSS